MELNEQIVAKEEFFVNNNLILKGTVWIISSIDPSDTVNLISVDNPVPYMIQVPGRLISKKFASIDMNKEGDIELGDYVISFDTKYPKEFIGKVISLYFIENKKLLVINNQYSNFSVIVSSNRVLKLI